MKFISEAILSKVFFYTLSVFAEMSIVFSNPNSENSLMLNSFCAKSILLIIK